MRVKKLVLQALVLSMVTVGLAHSQSATVKELLDLDSKVAIAAEKERLSKAQAAAKKESDALLPAPKFVAAPATVAPLTLRLFAMSGMSGQRRLRLSDGIKQPFELLENGGASFGLSVKSIEGQCVTLNQIPVEAMPTVISEARDGTPLKSSKNHSKKSMAQGQPKTPATISVCYSPEIQNTSVGMVATGMAAIPAPFVPQPLSPLISQLPRFSSPVPMLNVR